MNWQTVLWILKAITGLVGKIPHKKDLPVLIVEDDHNDAAIIASHVQGEGAESVTVRNLEDAEDYLRKNKVRLMFLDVAFPRGDGIAFAKRIRPHFPGLPVVIVTGNPNAVLHLPAGRKWSFVFKGSDGGSLKEAVQDALKEANGGERPPAFSDGVSRDMGAVCAVGYIRRVHPPDGRAVQMKIVIPIFLAFATNILIIVALAVLLHVR